MTETEDRTAKTESEGTHELAAQTAQEGMAEMAQAAETLELPAMRPAWPLSPKPPPCRGIAALGRITQLLATVADLPLALERVCEAVTLLFDAQVTYVILPSTEEPQIQALVGFNRESGPIGATPLPVSLSETRYFSQVLRQAKTVILSDVQRLPTAAPIRDFVARQQIQNVMLVPLAVRGSTIGLLAIATDQVDQVFSSDQSLLAETIAGDVAGAIENARLFEQAQEAAVSEERSRLARELHDSVTQTLYSVSIVADALPAS